LIRCEKIDKSYGERSVLKEIDVTFDKCGLVFVLGESGAGKSTLLNIIGLLDTEFAGNIVYKDDVLKRTDRKIVEKYHKNAVDFIFQEYNLVNTLTVLENIELALVTANKVIEEKEIVEVLASLKIDCYKDEYVKNLSGGERQRVAIARALCRNNGIILADEPTGNLDRDNADNFFEIIKEISKEKLVIVVSHNNRAAEQYADRIIEISEQSIIRDEDISYKDNNNYLEDKNETDVKTNGKTKGWIYKLTKRYWAGNKRKIIPAIIAMSICLLSIGIFVELFYSMRNIVKVINSSLYETDKYTVSSMNDKNHYCILEDGFLAELGEINNVNAHVEYHNEPLYIESIDGNRYDAIYYVVDDQDVFKDRYDDINGRLPKNKEEIVIGESFATLIFGTSDCLGEKIRMNYYIDNYIEGTICGIKANDEDMLGDIYIHKDLSDSISSNIISQEFITTKFESNDFEVIYLTAESEKNNDEIIYGREIQKENEILLSADSMNDFLSIIGVDQKYSKKEIETGKISEVDLSNVFQEKICLQGGNISVDMGVLTVCGIYLPKAQSAMKMKVILSEKLYDKYSTPLNTHTDIYVNSNSDKDMKIINDLVEEYGYKIDSEAGQRGRKLSVHLSVVVMIVLLFVVCMLIVTFFMIHYAVKENINDRIYEIGVEKALGASDAFVFKLFMFNSLCYGIVAAVVSCIIIFGITMSGIAQYKETNFMPLIYHPYIIICIAGVFISLIAGIYNVFKVSRKPILKCIREGK